MRTALLAALAAIVWALFAVTSCDEHEHQRGRARHKAVSVGLHTKWACVPPHLEASEWIAQEAGSTIFWSVVEDAVAATRSDPATFASDKDRHQWILRRIEQHVGSALSRLARWAIATRRHSLRVLLHATLGDEVSHDRLPASFGQESPFTLVLPNTASSESSKPLLFSDAEKLVQFLETPHDALAQAEGNDRVAQVQPSDHLFPSSCSAQGNIPIAILHGDFGSPSFAKWHSSLAGLARKCRVIYYLRHRFHPCDSGVAYLQGFTVEGTLKKTEYVVVDDRALNTTDVAAAQNFEPDMQRGPDFGGLDLAVLEGRYGVLADSLTRLRGLVLRGVLNVPLRDDEAAGTTAPWELKDAGMLMASKILKAENPLLAFQEAAENFPVLDFYGSQNLDDFVNIRASVSKFRREHVAGDESELHGIWINNRKVDPRKPLDVLDCATEIQRSWHSFQSLQLPDPVKLLRSRSTKDLNQFRIDLTSLSPEVLYVNNIEEDDMYASWTTDYTVLVEAYLQGRPLVSLPQLRKNLVTLLIVLDLSSIESLEVASVTTQIMMARLPIRVGFIVVPGDTDSTTEKAAAAAYYLFKQRGMSKLFDFVEALMQSLDETQPQNPDTTTIEKVFLKVANKSLRSAMRDPETAETILKMRKWASEAGFDSAVDVPYSVVNGLRLYNMVRQVVDVTAREQKRIAELIRDKVLLNPSSPGELVARTGLKFVGKLRTDLLDHASGRLPISSLFINQDERKWMDNIVYLAGGAHATVTLWAIGDVASETTRRLVGIALQWFSELSDDRLARTRIALIDSVSDDDFFTQAMAKWSLEENARLAAKALLEEVNLYDQQEAFTRREEETFEGTMERTTLGHRLGLENDEAAVIVNGRKVEPEKVSSSSELDFIVLVEETVTADLSLSQLGDKATGDAYLAMGSAIVRVDSICGTDRAEHPGLFESADGLFGNPELSYHAARTGSPLEVKAIVNPTGNLGPEASRLLTFLHFDMHANVTLGLLPRPTTRRVPSTLKKMVLVSDLLFDDQTKRLSKDFAPSAVLTHVPPTRIVTISVDTPRAWLIGASKCVHDLDNVILNNIEETTLRAEYALESLLVEGSCSDQSAGDVPPQGLKVELRRAPPRDDEAVDTLVMQNLGYFQLKADSPGRWFISTAEGRSTELYKVSEFYERGRFRYQARKVDETGGVFAIVDDLNGIMQAYLRVTRKPGTEKIALLNPEMSTTSTDEQQIHVFSVASGHLYERFMRIMILSVLKHATKPVKFWMLGNYLSPTFKALLPGFSKEYNFSYQFVTYRWPGWLREQTEKQRIIWAYKILFLDVLFPLSVPRIIFVDADQVVRGDLAELYSIDLEGAPYGYVPFCNSRKDVEGYRFWKSGFWSSHLESRPYHISALYVVDLQRFREGAAGDMLRAQYQSLSADPNSLSNLDQDLPNYVGSPRLGPNAVKIFSLPGKWLWCESWCDDESKKEAAVIDLCNNPMTKEPKLQSARRIIAEWVDLDDEATAAAGRAISLAAGEEDVGGPGNKTCRAADAKENELLDQPGTELHDEL